MDQVEEENVDSSSPPPISTSKSSNQPSPEEVEGLDNLVQCVNCGASFDVDMSSSSSKNQNVDLMKVNEGQVFKKRRIEEPPNSSILICSICRQQNLEDKPKLDGQDHVDEKMNIDVTVDGDDDDVDGEEMLQNPFEIDNVVEIILKNMNNLDDLKNARLINNTWNKNVVHLLSPPLKESQLKPLAFVRYRSTKLEKTVQLVKNSENRKIFQNFEFGGYFGSISNLPLYLPLSISEETFPQIFEIIDMTHPTHIIFIASDSSKNLDVKLFNEFLHKISQYIVHLQIRLRFTKEEFLVEEESLAIEFPKLKTLKIEEINHKTIKFIKMLLKKCHFVKDLKVDGSDLLLGDTLDELLPDLLTPEIVQNLEKLHVKDTRLGFDYLLEPCVNSKMNLKNFKVETTELFPKTPIFHRLKFSQLKLFLASQNHSLEKLTIHFQFFNYSDPDNSTLDFSLFLISAESLDMPQLENLTTLKLKLDRFFVPIESWTPEYWLVQPINLPDKLPKLKKIVISYDPRWKLSFVADKPCETVEELVLEKWSRGDTYMLDFVVLFPKIKCLKVIFYIYHGEEEMPANFSSMDGWSSTLKKIDLQFFISFPQNFNFRGFTSLSNLDHFYIHQQKKGDQNEIQFDFTPLFNMKKLSKLVIKNIKISEEVIELLLEKFPKLDYTF